LRSFGKKECLIGLESTNALHISLAQPPRVRHHRLLNDGNEVRWAERYLADELRLVDTANLTRGRHEIKFGGSYAWLHYQESGVDTNGIFKFAGGGTGNATARSLSIA
jgi:hypothetical protein